VPTESGNQSFWTTLPGILTAIGTVITAATGLLIALNQAGLMSPADSTVTTSTSTPATSGSTSPSPTAPTDGTALVGTWKGTAVVPGQAGSFAVRLEITSPCRLKQPCGTIFVGSLPCSGRATLWGIRSHAYEIRTDHFTDGSAAGCTPGAGDFFRLRDDGTLRYTTGYDDTRGVLYKTG
jgi:hypothetical protein